ncbi:MAG: hypothetical protein HS116_08430 [Planctomycetes bacterium]|nr:hypothetical protein [Planctomycetota bacterium]
MNMRIGWLGVVVLALLASAARADLVYLKNGGLLEGKVVRKGEWLHIEQADGTVIVEVSKVEQIVKQETDLEVFDKRFAKIDEDAEGAASLYSELGRWADGRRLKSRAEKAHRKAIALSPDLEISRTALGHVKVNGSWMTYDEAQQARGLVRHKDAWVTPEAKIDLTRLEAETELEAKRLEVEKVRLERAKTEADTARIVAETERDRLERDRYDRTYGDYYSGWPVVIVGGRGYRPPPPPRDPAEEAARDAQRASAYRNFPQTTQSVPGMPGKRTVVSGTGPIAP